MSAEDANTAFEASAVAASFQIETSEVLSYTGTDHGFCACVVSFGRERQAERRRESGGVPCWCTSVIASAHSEGGRDGIYSYSKGHCTSHLAVLGRRMQPQRKSVCLSVLDRPIILSEERTLVLLCAQAHVSMMKKVRGGHGVGVQRLQQRLPHINSHEDMHMHVLRPPDTPRYLYSVRCPERSAKAERDLVAR